MKQEAIDYVITADEDYLPLFAARFLGIPGMHGFHSLSNIQHLAQATNHVKFLKNRMIFADSQFLRSKISTLLGLEAVVWYPPIDFNAYLAQRSGERTHTIGFSSAGWFKGDEIVNQIVKRMPECSFIVVGGRYGGWTTGNPPSNLAYWGHLADMRTLYGQIDLLLVPSLVEEGFPRVILEAAVNRIPAIGNRVGGVPEAIGDSGVLIDVDLSALNITEIAERYVQEIRRLMSDDGLYRQYGQKAIARAESYQQEQMQSARTIYDRYFR